MPQRSFNDADRRGLTFRIRGSRIRRAFASNCLALIAASVITAGLTPSAHAQAQVQAQAQATSVANVGVFERVAVGNVEVTPITVLRDDRCPDPRLCTQNGSLIVSAVMRDYRGLYEVLLELDRPVAVPGGFLVLRSAGTAPALRGAVDIDDYRLTLDYLPLFRRQY